MSRHQPSLWPIAYFRRRSAATTAAHMPTCASTSEHPYLAVPPSMGMRPGRIKEGGAARVPPGLGRPPGLRVWGLALPVQTRPVPSHECDAGTRSAVRRLQERAAVSEQIPEVAAACSCR